MDVKRADQSYKSAANTDTKKPARTNNIYNTMAIVLGIFAILSVVIAIFVYLKFHPTPKIVPDGNNDYEAVEA